MFPNQVRRFRDHRCHALSVRDAGLGHMWLPASLPAGGTVHLTLTVTGPIDYEIGCVQTLHIWAEDNNHRQVWQQPVPAIQCMALGHKLLNAGETATLTADWPTSRYLAPGSYSIHGLFLTVLPMGAGMRVRENLPLLTVQVLA